MDQKPVIDGWRWDHELYHHLLLLLLLRTERCLEHLFAVFCTRSGRGVPSIEPAWRGGQG